MTPRVPLYGRFPFGHGTYLTESLTSLVTRLAHARSLTTTDVVGYLAFPRMDNPPSRNVGWFLNRGASSLDGLGEHARSFVAAIEALTGQSGLAHHTMLPWARLLNVHHAGALHPGSKRWCSRCFEFWDQHGITPWEPLIWRVKMVRRCPVHRTVLSEFCPSCSKPQPVVNKRVPAGVCTNCGALLHEGDPLLHSGDVEPEFGSDECWEYWYALAVARMLSVQSDMNESASSFGFVRLVVEAVEEFGDGKSQKLAKHLGLSYTLINRITTENYLPRLEYFLTVTMRLGADPAEIALAPYGSLFRTPWAPLRDRVQPWPKFTWSSPRRQVSYSPGFWAQIGERVDREIAEGGRRSLTELARSLGVSTDGLKHNFPEKAARLVRVHAERVKLERDAKHRNEERVVRAAVVALVRSGIHPIARFTFAQAGLSGSMHVPRLRQIWHDQKRLCGVTD